MDEEQPCPAGSHNGASSGDSNSDSPSAGGKEASEPVVVLTKTDYVLRVAAVLSGSAVFLLYLIATIYLPTKLCDSDQLHDINFGQLLASATAWTLIFNLAIHYIVRKQTKLQGWRLAIKVASYAMLVYQVDATAKSEDISFCDSDDVMSISILIGPMTTVVLHDAFSTWGKPFNGSSGLTLHQRYWANKHDNDEDSFECWMAIMALGAFRTLLGMVEDTTAAVQVAAASLAGAGLLIMFVAPTLVKCGYCCTELTILGHEKMAEILTLVGVTVPAVMYELSDSTSSIVGGAALALVGADELLELLLVWNFVMSE